MQMITDQAATRRALRLALSLPASEGGRYLHALAQYATTDADAGAVSFARDHLVSNGKLPHPDTLTSETGAVLPISNETIDYEMERAKAAYVEAGLRSAVDDASQTLNGSKDVHGALKNLTHALLQLSQSQAAPSLTDLRDAADTILPHYQAQLQGLVPPPLKTGYPTLDAKGSFREGDLLSVVGRPGAGKTYLMLRLALWRWGQYGVPTLFVTQEMSAEAVQARAVPMVAGVPVGPLYEGRPLQYVVGGMTHEDYESALKEAAESMRDVTCPFLIYDTRMAGTVADVESIAAMYGIEHVYVDGAYLLSHPDRRLNRYQKVAENLDLLKNWTQRAGVMLATSWQFKRGSGKSGADEEAELDDIGYSNAVAEFSTVVLGLLSPPKSVSEMKQRTVTVMKGRNGEAGKFKVHFDFQTMNFEEVEEAEVKADLDYL